GYTIRGVQRILKEQGLRYVQTIWQPGAPSPAQTSEDADFAGEDGDASERGRGLFGLLPSLIGNASEEQQEAKEEVEDAEEVEEDEDEDLEDDDDEIDEDEDEEEDDDDEDEEDDEEDDEEEKAAPRQQALRPLALKGKSVLPAGGALRA